MSTLDCTAPRTKSVDAIFAMAECDSNTKMNINSTLMSLAVSLLQINHAYMIPYFCQMLQVKIILSCLVYVVLRPCAGVAIGKNH